MANQMLILFAIFTERANRVGLANGAAQLQSQHSMAVFSFFLFIVYSVFGSVLAIFRNDVVKQDNPGKQERTFLRIMIFAKC